MTTLQEYLNQKYPTQKEKEKAREIIINWGNRKNFKEIDGRSLELSEYPNLEKVKINGHSGGYMILKSKLTSLDLSNCPKLTELDCSCNQLTKLRVNNCPQLEFFNCSSNLLTNLDFFGSLGSEKLKKLWVYNNNFSEQNLNCFRRFINLERLFIGNDNQEKINQNIYNRFKGSLEPLRNMNKLTNLHISNTDIDSGLEYLPDRIINFWYSTKERPQTGKQEIWQELIKFRKQDNNEFSLRLREWKEVHLGLMAKVRLENIKSKLASNEQQFIDALAEQLIKSQQEAQYWKNKYELAEFKKRLTPEEQEWLEVYYEAQQESEHNSFAQKQLERAQYKLINKLNKEELRIIIRQQKEIIELEKKLANYQNQELEQTSQIIHNPPKI